MRRRSLVWVWFLAAGCAAEAPTPLEDDEGQAPPDVTADQEVCDDVDWAHLECPAGYTPQWFSGDFVVLELEDVARPVCGGRGLFIDAADVEGADKTGFLVTSNSVCTFGCFGTCGVGLNVCITERPDGSPCVRTCSILGEDDCREVAQECAPEQACEG